MKALQRSHRGERHCSQLQMCKCNSENTVVTVMSGIMEEITIQPGNETEELGEGGCSNYSVPFHV